MKTVLALLLLTGGAPALAQTPPPPAQDASTRGGGAAMLMRADANGDGAITRDEMIAAADQRFDRRDANRDGTITPDERPMLERGDGAPPPGSDTRRMPEGPRGEPITREQSRARALRMFDRADDNRDGRVTADELTMLRARAIGGIRPYRPASPSAPPRN